MHESVASGTTNTPARHPTHGLPVDSASEHPESWPPCTMAKTKDEPFLRILVTGGCGFLGSHICRRLVNEGHDVVALDNFFTSQKTNVKDLLDKPNFEVIRGDVTKEFFIEVDQVGGQRTFGPAAARRWAPPPPPPIITSGPRCAAVCSVRRAADLQHGVPRVAGALPVQPGQDDEDLGHRHDEHARSRQARQGAHLAGVDVGGVRRPGDLAADGGLLGPRQLQRRALVLRRGQARRRDALLRLQQAEQRRHSRGAHLQHVRCTARARTRRPLSFLARSLAAAHDTPSRLGVCVWAGTDRACIRTTAASSPTSSCR
jgi:hypothetical protein